MIKRLLTLPLLAALFTTACAQQDAPARIVKQFSALYPNTRFSQIRPSPISGLYEVVMGENIAYTDETGRYFLFGHLFDMQTQVDMTPRTQIEARKTTFPTPFLTNAIKTVKGDGSRVFAVFSDPDCPYCQQLEGELARLANVTIYTFLYPLASRHPAAKTKAISVWCAPNPAHAWRELMLAGKKPKLTACPNPVNDNLVLGTRLGVVGTPTLIAADGRVLAGFAPLEKIDHWLDAARMTGAVQSKERKALP